MILLFASGCLDNNDALHQNALDYFKYFLLERITIHISTIAVAEYAVGDDPASLPVNNLQIESFDFLDAKTAGLFHREIKGNQSNILNYHRRIITNDVKILAQISTKAIDAIISKDVNSLKQYVQPLINANLLQVKFFDLNTSFREVSGKLF